MALAKFNAPTLPNPPAVYDAQYVRQLIRTLEIYHNQLDSSTPNYAESYTADFFFGVFVARNFTTAEKLALPLVKGAVIFDTTLGKLCVCNGLAWQTITSA